MHPLVQLAKEAVEQYVRAKKSISPPDKLTTEMAGKAGVFVCVKIKGELRGCVGTFSPCMKNVACEIIQNAISAATQDPRFPPVNSKELEQLEYSVDVLTEPEKVAGKKQLDPKRYGVIIRSGDRRGLLLPDLEGVDTVDEQISIASMKAGIFLGEEIEIYRFEVKRYK
ncbi:MAG: AmmeMemoRadiSam system protein A [Nitrospirae bacterium]|nr:AmmeMemoRadiSam system protein A [Nitrospirota bacterium]